MKYVNYLEYTHSYAHATEPILKQLNYVANVKKDLQFSKNIVLKALKKPEVIFTDKEIQFRQDILNCITPAQVYFRTKNAINRAKEIIVPVNDEGYLI